MTDTNKIIPHPRHYWGITKNGETCFTGTHSQCWDKLVEYFGTQTLAELETAQIRLERIK